MDVVTNFAGIDVNQSKTEKELFDFRKFFRKPKSIFRILSWVCLNRKCCTITLRMGQFSLFLSNSKK